jgi:hypothetical protein
MNRVFRALSILLIVILLPAVASAQANIASSLVGVVRDTSGAVLPGVTVEASSSALIEKVRTAVTDANGQYRIVNLPPGAYAVTFSLTGFSTVRREGIELAGSFVATINTELRVGSLEETITVSGEAPIVDVQSAGRQQVLDRRVLDAVPSGRQYFSFTGLVPSISAQGNDVGGLSGPIFSVFQVHGGRRDEGRVQVDGQETGFQGTAGVSYYVADVANAAEITFSLPGGSAETVAGGPVMNVLPRQGANTFRGSFFVSGSSGALQGGNFTDELRQSVRTPNELEKLWDTNAGIGGPIAKDKFWFYLAGRHQGNRKTIAGLWFNRNAGDPTKWTYEPDLNRVAKEDGTWKNANVRLTWQMTQRNKLDVYWDEQSACINCLGGGTVAVGAIQSPEAHPMTTGFPQRVNSAKWTSPLTNRLLLEGRFSTGPQIQFGSPEREGNDRSLIRVTELGGSIPGISYRGLNWSRPWGGTTSLTGAASYITGAHSLKIGTTFERHRARAQNYTNDPRLTYTFLNGVPTQLAMTIAGFRTESIGVVTGLYVQERWTVDRLTLQGGLRYDHVGSWYPAQQVGADRFLSATLTFPEQDSPVNMNDISPRMGAVYDLFGNGKTAVKTTFGRYLDPAGSGGIYAAAHNPITRLVTTTNRAWTDTNRNFAPDCDLRNPIAQDFSASGGDVCGPFSNRNFATSVVDTTYDTALLDGWGVRPRNWDLWLSLQHELLPRVSVEGSWVWRTWGNRTVTDNRAVSAADFDSFCVTTPTDSRLERSGQQLCGLADVKPEKFGLVDNFITKPDAYGKLLERYNGFDVSVNARLTRLTLQGGFSTGSKMTDDCEIVAKVPEAYITGNTVVSREFCHLESPYLTKWSSLAAYTVPKIDVVISGTFRSTPIVGANLPSIQSQSLAANWVVPNATIAPSLGRNLTGTQNRTINVVKPGTLYGERLNNVDFRVGKNLQFGGKRINASVDVYNVLNVNSPDAYQQTFATTNNRWLVPTSITPARFARLSAQFDF